MSFLKKNIRKIIAPIIAAIGICVASGSALAADTAVISLNNTAASAGDTFKLNISVDSIPSTGITSGEIFVKYDKTNFTFNGYEKGDEITSNDDLYVVTDDPHYADGLILYYSDSVSAGSGSTHLRSSGVFARLSFTAKSTCPNGVYNFIPEGRPVGYEGNCLYTQVTVPVPVSYSAGKVVVPQPNVSVSMTNATGFRESVQTSLQLSNIPATGLSSGEIWVSYDSTKLEYQSLTAGSIVANPTDDIMIDASKAKNPNGLVIYYTSAPGQEIKVAGELAKLTFKVLNTAGPGNYNITPSAPSSSVYEALPFYTMYYVPVTATYTKGVITVPTVKWGDSDGNGVVATGDLSLVKRRMVNPNAVISYKYGFTAGDVDANKTWTTSDLSAIKRKIVGGATAFFAKDLNKNGVIDD